MELLSSTLIAIAATVFVVLGSMMGDVTKKTMVVVSATSFVVFFILTYSLGLSDLVLSLL